VNFQNNNIGIIGCGHLGISLAKSFLVNKIIKENNLSLSCRGSKASLARIHDENLSHRLLSNKEVAKRSDILILAVKPQDIFELSNLEYKENTFVLSFIAGISEISLKRVLGANNIVRGIISGPDTIMEEKAVVAVSQSCNEAIINLFKPLAKLFYLLPEKHIDLVSSLVTLPGLLLLIDSKNRSGEVAAAISEIEKVYYSKYLNPRDLYHWACQLKPSFYSSTKLASYLSAMATKGGVTEAVMNEFMKGGSIFSAITSGADRSRQIADEVNTLIESTT